MLINAAVTSKSYQLKHSRSLLTSRSLGLVRCLINALCAEIFTRQTLRSRSITLSIHVSVSVFIRSLIGQHRVLTLLLRSRHAVQAMATRRRFLGCCDSCCSWEELLGAGILSFTVDSICSWFGVSQAREGGRRANFGNHMWRIQFWGCKV